MGASSVSPVVVARLAATAAQEVPDVLGLHGGAVGEVATYGPNGPVRGVRVRLNPEPRLQLRLIVRFGARLDEVAEAVRARAAAVMAEHVPAFAEATIYVHIADVRQRPVDEEHAARALPRASSRSNSDDTATRTPPGNSARQP